MRRRWYGMGVVVLAGLAAVVPAPPESVDRWFSRGWFPSAQRVMTPLSNLAPFALLDVLLLAAAVAVAWVCWTVIRSARGSRLAAAGRGAWRGVIAAAIVYLAFLGLWGFNYRRPPVGAFVDFDASRVTNEAVQALNARAVAEIARLRPTLPESLADWPARDAVARDLAPALAATVRALGLPEPVVPARPKTTILDPYFTRAGVSGMTDPLLLETLMATNLLPFETPMVVAHEWGHLAGLARESDASFFGWVLCLRGNDAARYSAWLEAFVHTLAGFDRADRRAVIERLDAGARRDLRAAAERSERDQVRSLNLMAWATYDRYLKANRVESGTRNYGEVLQLMVGTRFEEGWRPVLRSSR